MASRYGRNFGFRRSDEHLRSGNEGRFKVPKTGEFFQGDLVEIDPANPGYVKKADAGKPIEPGFRGFLIQENAHLGSIFDVGGPIRSQLRDVKVANDQLCSIWTGAGLKVWLRNTEAPKGGRSPYPARDVVTATGTNIGDYLGWDGTKFVKAAGASTAVGHITLTNGQNYLEATLVK